MAPRTDTLLKIEVIILETTITYNQDNYYQYQPYTGEFNLKPQQEATPYEPYTPSQDDKKDKLKVTLNCIKDSETILGGEYYVIHSDFINEIIDYINSTK